MTKYTIDPADQLLTPAETAEWFRVDVKTLSRWARTGKLRSVRTVGGHRRFYLGDVQALLAFPDEDPK